MFGFWNALPDSLDFTSLNKFKESISHIDFNNHLMQLVCVTNVYNNVF